MKAAADRALGKSGNGGENRGGVLESNEEGVRCTLGEEEMEGRKMTGDDSTMYRSVVIYCYYSLTGVGVNSLCFAMAMHP